MKAAVIYEHGGAGSIQFESNFPDPKPAADEVVVKVGAASLNYHDVFTRNGMPGITVPLPVIMGLDFAGEIVEVGSAVTEWQVGDRVLIDPSDRKTFGGVIGEARHGGLAEYCAVPDHHLVRMPDDVTYEEAASLPVAYGTAYRMMVTIGKIQAGERVLILGASGGVGTCCVQLAKLAGAEVIAAASSQDKLDKLAALGADHLVDYKQHDFMKWVFEKFGKPHRRLYEKGVDVAVNFTGGDTWVKSLRTLHRGGRVLTCGATAGYDPKEDLRFVWSYELQILGSNGWARDDLHTLLDLVRQKKLKPTIDKTFQLTEVNQAFAQLEDRLVFGKVIVKP
ncbi:zinc-binding dehydrogenase [Chitinasiproducens palmae]|uniref:2-desacetyl-2-hydroxyethyl bacteriochlorophyllide A dehydrogenase n=1 Tax=Chitinasiproducens palmae TaxID=1770053 RepID=A0A1H2PN01_9BURK|nr:zinc-binding dehydrogenase [Chitinasiproducens palmae]SDV48040.1 2-desacetyl-2-hydroxyethyl bacteriochlorophyllide A dehydrogenase [Chitinasiproducens palmae]